MQRRDSPIARVERAVLVDHRPFEARCVVPALVELVARVGELAAQPLELCGRGRAAADRVAKLDELRRDLLPLVLDFGLELGDGFSGDSRRRPPSSGGASRVRRGRGECLARRASFGEVAACSLRGARA